MLLTFSCLVNLEISQMTKFIINKYAVEPNPYFGENHSIYAFSHYASCSRNAKVA
jgi:hypothetical protein